jgi:5-formyltetrahydrofolate cyclo-ligase
MHDGKPQTCEDIQLLLAYLGGWVKITPMDKKSTRAKLLAARAALSAEQVIADSARVCLHLANWPLFRRAHVVMAYLAFRSEISLQPLIDTHPDKTWLLPRTLHGGRLEPHVYQPDRLVRHPCGMLEPAEDSLQLPMEEIELVLTPGVGFDAQGGRLGFGGGYYDRLLSQLTAVRVGVAHTVSVIAKVPSDDHDCRMDWLVQPAGLKQIT